MIIKPAPDPPERPEDPAKADPLIPDGLTFSARLGMPIASWSDIGYSMKIRKRPLSHWIWMSAPFGVTGSPVAVSMNAMSGEVEAVPVSLKITTASHGDPAGTD